MRHKRPFLHVYINGGYAFSTLKPANIVIQEMPHFKVTKKGTGSLHLEGTKETEL